MWKLKHLQTKERCVTGVPFFKKISQANTKWCCYLSLGCLLEAHIRSGLLRPGLWMASPAVRQTCCPFVICKRCPCACGAFSGSLTWKNPRSPPCPPLSHNHPNSLTLCVPSLAECEKAKVPGWRKRTQFCVSENYNTLKWWWHFTYGVVNTRGHGQVSRHIWWGKDHLRR